MSQSSSASARPDWRVMVGLFSLSIFSRSLLLYHRLTVQRIPFDRLGGSDVPGWLGMANHLLGDRDLSYYLMGARPPLFPLTVALVYGLGGNRLHAVLLQIVFGALTVVVGYVLACRLLGVARLPNAGRMALIAGMIMALDPASVSASGSLLAEPLFNLLFTACLLSLVVFIQSGRWRGLVLVAVWLALAMLTRTTAIYLWLIVPLMLAPFVKRWWWPALTLAVVGLAVYLGWSARNLRYQGVFTYSLQTNFSLLFLRALSAEHLATGVSSKDLQLDYVRTLYLSVGEQELAEKAAPEHFWRFLVADDPRLYAEMGRMARRKLLLYWPHALLGTGIGAWRMFALTGSLPTWFGPIELLYHALLYGLAAWGAWQSFRYKDRLLLLTTGLPILYVTALTLISQTSAMDSRMRTPISAPIIILAAYGLGRLLETRSKRLDWSKWPAA